MLRDRPDLESSYNLFVDLALRHTWVGLALGSRFVEIELDALNHILVEFLVSFRYTLGVVRLGSSEQPRS